MIEEKQSRTKGKAEIKTPPNTTLKVPLQDQIQQTKPHTHTTMLAKFQRKSDKQPKIKSSNKITRLQNEAMSPSESKPKTKPIAMRLFSRNSKPSPKSNRSSMVSDLTISSSTAGGERAVVLPRTRLGSTAYSSLASPPLSPLSPRVVESASVWNAAGQDITTLPTRHRNTSSSNLSTTSTLLELPPSAPTPAPPQNNRYSAPPTNYYPPSSPVRESSDSYEAFLGRAQEQDRRRDAVMTHAWMRADERRKASRNWPSDPWRGGFGPPNRGNNGMLGRRDGGVQALNPKRINSNDSGVRGWLGRNGLVGR